jgi:predicted phage-related endonuclease
MRTINLIQGSNEWKAHRANHFNASDSPAMMGCSPYTSRSELLRKLHSGIDNEVSPATQRIFDDGHRFEALARPLAEAIIEDDLYPVTGVNGKYSASFDGLNLTEDVAFEHKTLNDDIRAAFQNMDDQGRNLPLVYRVQMEHQCLVSGCSKVLFMATRWNGEELLEEEHCWYVPDPDLRAKIVAGWAQFESDLKDYTPTAIAEPAATGKAPETLPALRIEVTGMVTASNLAEFKETALTAIRSVNRSLASDQDFADAEVSVKWCSEVESRLAAAKEHALSQTASIDQLFKAIDDISAEARKVRLELDKLVKTRKEQIRLDMVSEAKRKFDGHMEALNNRIGKPLMPKVQEDFAGVIKGKRTITSLRDAVDTELARIKILANEIADGIAVNLRTIEASEHKHLFPDLSALVQKSPDDLGAVMEQRIAKFKQDQEAARQNALRLEQEKQAREAEAAAKTAEVLQQVAQTPPVVAAAPVAQPDSLEMMRLGEINARLSPINLTAEGLAWLGFAHIATDRSAKLYRASDFPRICQKLIKHIENNVLLPA